ncbi:hypothetical protein ANCDUO_04758 [Ancylostoma duodenale]|uniref:FAD/NAD(P)-binding domain-containing protein n=1 Tax=Ancylostoma duodenale TaxID=51022 RepID=A0A0C2H684_9BILA|nr:hypothetical protein ANCDUO_04758 [Ancylostoma duodenale]
MGNARPRHNGLADEIIMEKRASETLVKVVNDRIKANSWIYRVQLHEKFLTLIAPNVVLATGLRPRYPEIPGAEHGITSDDLFWAVKSPGKTLVVGASYVALETAGMLADLGLPVDLLIRSRPLKPFDQSFFARYARKKSPVESWVSNCSLSVASYAIRYELVRQLVLKIEH